MGLKLYYLSVSPPCRAVLLTIRYLKLDVEVITVDLFKGEHLNPEFVKLNPAHQVPVLVDGDFVLCESRAIMAYLVSKYQPGSSLYPTDIYKRAIVDQRLYFDMQAAERNAVAVVRL
jgi:glutathione S-transferase